MLFSAATCAQRSLTATEYFRATAVAGASPAPATSESAAVAIAGQVLCEWWNDASTGDSFRLVLQAAGHVRGTSWRCGFSWSYCCDNLKLFRFEIEITRGIVTPVLDFSPLTGDASLHFRRALATSQCHGEDEEPQGNVKGQRIVGPLPGLAGGGKRYCRSHNTCACVSTHGSLLFRFLACGL